MSVPDRTEEARKVTEEIERLNREEPGWMNRILEEVDRKLSPPADGKCLREKCGGKIVKKLTGLYRRQCLYQAGCSECNARYFYDTSTLPLDQRSVDRFHRIMNEPYTI